MSHLSTDRLAALGDEQPSPAEAAHLSACAECARERDAYRTLVAMAHAERAAIGLPLTRWDAISSALAAERTTPALHEPRATRVAGRGAMQIAAGLLLVAGGAVLGRMSSGTTPLRSVDPGASAVTAATSGARVATDSVFNSVEEARAAQARSELLYQQAAAFLAQHDSGSSAGDNPVAYRSRLAALDRVLSTTREALREAPHDPVINGYYLTTIGQREATLRQLNTTLPSSLRLGRF